MLPVPSGNARCAARERDEKIRHPMWCQAQKQSNVSGAQRTDTQYCLPSRRGGVYWLGRRTSALDLAGESRPLLHDSRNLNSGSFS